MTKYRKAGIMFAIIIHEKLSSDKSVIGISRDFMKISRRICLLFCIIFLVMGIAMPVCGQESRDQATSTQYGSVGLDAQKPLGGSEKMLDTAKAAILYELTGNTMVYAWNPDEAIDPSGMNKLLTALIALEKGNPADMITVSRTVVQSSALIGSVSAGLKYGEEISLKDLLYCMMVGSANDAAVVIAEHISGTEETFVELMNARAVELGCTNTYFVNASGLPQQGQYTTARDLAKITVTALENEMFADMFCAVNYTVPETNKVGQRYIVTTNYLTSKESVKTQFDSRVTGGKTGALSTTDRSLISTAEHSGKRYLVVVMSAKGTVTADGLSVKTFGSFEETRALLDFGFRQYSFRQVLQSGQPLEQFPVSSGENPVYAGVAADLYSALPVDVLPEDISFRCVLDGELTAPLAQGQVIGTAQVWYQDICVGFTELVALHDVRSQGQHLVSLVPSGEAEADDTLKNWLILGSLVLAAMVLLSGIVVGVIIMVRKHQMDRRHRLINEGMD